MLNLELSSTLENIYSLLFSNSEAWKKKSTDSFFNFTMGSYGVAEICELLGLYNITSKDDIGLYRDDG